MRRGFLIDAHGEAWSAARPDIGAATADAPALLYLGPATNGIEVAWNGGQVPARTLSRALRILASWRPRRIALTRLQGGEVRTEIFSGIWEFAARAETLPPAAPPEPVPAPALRRS